MATVDWALGLQMVDANNAPAPVRIKLKTTSGLLADIEAAAAGLATVIDGVSEAQIQRADVVIEQVLGGGLKTVPVAGSNNSVGGLTRWDTTSSLDRVTYWIPAWLTAGFQEGHENLIDQGQAAVLAFINFMLATTSTTTVTDEDANNLTALFRGTKSVRKFRRALGRAR